MYICTGSGRIELNIKYDDAKLCNHSGQCDDDVYYVSKLPYLRKQLDKIDPQILADELKDYGAWDETDLKDHEQNIQRIVWILCGDLTEQYSRNGKRIA